MTDKERSGWLVLAVASAIGLLVAGLLAGCNAAQDGAGGSGGDGGGGGGAGASPGCEGAALLARPADPGVRGPWAVGARTVQIAGLTAEVWYPARAGSDTGLPKVRYDLREHLPPSEGAKIPDADNPLQDCDCFRDLPLDEVHGPYPLVLFVHGTAGFRTQSLTLNTHWASRGFVVVSADHPGINLAAVLSNQFGGDQAGDAGRLLDALATPAGEIAFLGGHLDGKRIGMAGHSAGGGAIRGFGGRAQVLMPLAAGGTQAGAALSSTLVMGGTDDGIARYSQQQSGYGSSPARKRLVGLSKAGHLAFSDLCFIGRDRGGILMIAQSHGVTVPAIVGSLARDGCKPGQLAAETGWQIIEYATAAALEETLMCSPAMGAQLAHIQGQFPDVGELQELLQ